MSDRGSFPRVGMHYEDVRNKLKRYKYVKDNPNALESLLNQARLHEGSAASEELAKEYYYDNEGVRAFSGKGNKQCGIGPGKKPSEKDGWTKSGGKWVKYY